MASISSTVNVKAREQFQQLINAHCWRIEEALQHLPDTDDWTRQDRFMSGTKIEFVSSPMPIFTGNAHHTIAICSPASRAVEVLSSENSKRMYTTPSGIDCGVHCAGHRLGMGSRCRAGKDMEENGHPQPRCHSCACRSVVDMAG